MVEYLQIGEIVKVHGIKGELSILPLTDDPARFQDLKKVFLDNKGKYEEYDLQYSNVSQNTIVVKLKGIDDRDRAEDLKGKYLAVPRSEAVPLPENSFFICDIIECEVYDVSRGLLGIISNVWQTGSNDVYEVRSTEGRTVLIPALKDIFLSVDTKSKRITVRLPEGLV
ncbi:MAG: ribosome maturation factor RimM [Eubacteriales bacterium]|nr:ribosome maturation factor RimM [Eubacteriales bacterium]